MMSNSVLRRLRAAKLRPTVARIGVLQTIEASPTPVSAEEVFRQMLLRGTRVSMGTVYRAMHQFESDGLLLREWDRNRKALYSIKPAGLDTAALRLVCPDTGRVLVMEDAVLHAHLLSAARHHGVALEGHALSVQVAQAGTLQQGIEHSTRRAHGFGSAPRLAARRT